MSNRLKKDIQIVLDYLWHDEKSHYQCGPSKNHIYSVLRRLAKDVGYRAS
jgi:hypothetical protein